MRRHVNALVLTMVGCLAAAVTQSLRWNFIVSSSCSTQQRFQLGHRCSRKASAASSPSESVDQRLVGAWRYAGGAYEIRETNGNFYFHEHVSGELRPQGEWLVAELPTAGTIRLQLSNTGNEVTSNFKVTGTTAWGDTITAVREWESLQIRAKELQRHLKAITFNGVVDGVTVTLDGQQRPVSLSITPHAAAAADLGAKIVEASEKARDESMAVMTERLREAYADHFGGKAPGAA